MTALFGCNWVQLRAFDRKLEANAHLLRNLLAKRYVLLQLAVAVRNALVGVTEPEANEILWCLLFPQPRGTEPPECVSTRFRLFQLL